MKYVKLVMKVENRYQEPLIAELSEMKFEGFQQNDGELTAYIVKERFQLQDREVIEQLLSGYPGNNFVKSEEIIADQNWNRVWEKTIEAQTIGQFLVRPTWSNTEVDPDQILLEIDPKMAFGTGYHATTQLMLRQLPEMISENDVALDAGTGTGILAIAAVKLGAEHVFAFDIDDWSITNARENIHINEVSDKVTIRKGDTDVVDHDAIFDIVLANIQKNVIMEIVPFLVEHLKEGGQLLLSGILEKDKDDISNLLLDNDIQNIKTFKEAKWVAIQGQK